MKFWIVSTLLTLIAVLAVLLPLTRRKETILSPENNDLEVYRDQLREVDTDAARGMIDSQSAEQARAEISRRILLAEKARKEASVGAGATSNSLRWVSLLGVIAIPLIAWGVYPLFGSPDMPSMPLAERLAQAPNANSVAELIARAEAHLAQNPNDVRGWDVLGPIYLRIGRAPDAASAFRSAIRLDGENTNRLLGLAAALIAASGGTITAEAEEQLKKAVAIDPNDIRPQMYLAEGEMQDGKPEAAANRLQAMLDKAPADVPWRAEIKSAVEAIRKGPTAVPSSGEATNAPGPTSQDMENAAGMNAEDRTAMIEGMVQRLDEKLRQGGGAVEDWKRLVRSYMILNKQDAAIDALKRGLGSLDDGAREELKKFATELGLSAEEAKP